MGGVVNVNLDAFATYARAVILWHTATRHAKALIGKGIGSVVVDARVECFCDETKYMHNEIPADDR